MANRSELKALLARAGIEISDAIKRIDCASDSELSNVEQSIKGLESAFFDFNGSCGAITPSDLVAFFDFNGSCGLQNPLLAEALDKAVSLRKRG